MSENCRKLEGLTWKSSYCISPPRAMKSAPKYNGGGGAYIWGGVQPIHAAQPQVLWRFALASHTPRYVMWSRGSITTAMWLPAGASGGGGGELIAGKCVAKRVETRLDLQQESAAGVHIDRKKCKKPQKMQVCRNHKKNAKKTHVHLPPPPWPGRISRARPGGAGPRPSWKRFSISYRGLVVGTNGTRRSAHSLTGVAFSGLNMMSVLTRIIPRIWGGP